MWRWLSLGLTWTVQESDLREEGRLEQGVAVWAASQFLLQGKEQMEWQERR